jgi:hypothetical protein
VICHSVFKAGKAADEKTAILMIADDGRRLSPANKVESYLEIEDFRIFLFAPKGRP